MTRLKWVPVLAAALAAVPGLLYAQASPFLTGVTSLQENILEWLTPVAIILVMVLGGMAMANRISWGWCIGAIFGIAIAFGAPVGCYVCGVAVQPRSYHGDILVDQEPPCAVVLLSGAWSVRTPVFPRRPFLRPSALVVPHPAAGCIGESETVESEQLQPVGH